MKCRVGRQGVDPAPAKPGAYRTSAAGSIAVLLGTLAVSSLAVSSLASSSLAAPAPLPGRSGNLLVAESELQVTYGTYAETTLSLPNAEGRTVEWSILGSSLPPGMAVADRREAALVLYGTPRFTGAWCTVFVARTASGGSDEIRGQSEICLNAADDPALVHPRFASDDRYLPTRAPGAAISEMIAVRDASTGEVLESELSPEKAKIDYAASAFRVSGRVDTAGTYVFALRVRSAKGVETYHQYELTVRDERENPACPDGYAFDPELGYCVAAAAEAACPVGSYFEPAVGSCAAYPAPPSTIACAPGSYFDPFLADCVPAYAERCPLNYAYDPYAGRCVRRPYTCGFGERYDYGLKDCIRVYAAECGYGSHFDYGVQRCVRDFVACYPGFYYRSAFGQCEPVPYRCGYDEVFDPRYGACRSIRTSACGYGTRWEPSTGRCEAVFRDQAPRCSRGTRYDPARRSCLPYESRSTPRPPIGRPNAPAYCGDATRFDPAANRCIPRENPRTPRNGPREPSGGPICRGGVYDAVRGRCLFSGGGSPAPRRYDTDPARPSRTPTAGTRSETPRSEAPRAEGPRDPVSFPPSPGRQPTFPPSRGSFPTHPPDAAPSSPAPRTPPARGGFGEATSPARGRFGHPERNFPSAPRSAEPRSSEPASVPSGPASTSGNPFPGRFGGGSRGPR